MCGIFIHIVLVHQLVMELEWEVVEVGLEEAELVVMIVGVVVAIHSLQRLLVLQDPHPVSVEHEGDNYKQTPNI